ncbi:AER264Cp [Eremothecium gossypii ATCC 10895]|uniref:MAP kinase kinase kinase n=1 Tax=Eremothecium gossypii (strain ATCC 10895 / CBS 109.51 / FGSC 9923 / NRRL Y-1056) TaxID=284811 RepID=Q756W3_EREGS|nr:AER264Cp [Eremothecium gossypii ATCC 10895]AAS52945.2 AER264Cp [Eremothecium gossypii ATCC 10895]AEY97252.1 FAER264Cp [Eremothecium gossypii FDAG1]
MRARSEGPGRNLSPRTGVPRSPAVVSSQGILRSPSLKSGASPMSTLGLGWKHGQQSPTGHVAQYLSPLSADSSSAPSRKTSITGLSTLRGGSPSRKPRSNSVSSNFKMAEDAENNTPTLVLPPSLASLNSQSTLSTVYTGNPAAAANPEASSSSSKSGNSATSSLRSGYKPMKRQYVLNEQLYLSRMKNSHLDDYYTRGIAPTMNDDEEDDTDLDTPDVNIDNDDQAFGSNVFTFHDRETSRSVDNELVMLSTKHLLGKMNWLRELDPGNPDIEAPLEFLARAENVSINSATPQDNRQDIEGMLGKLSRNPLVQERLEWQTMLWNVLRGDIVNSEKTKLAEQRTTDELTTQFSDELWLELKSWLYGRSVEDQRTWLQYLRASTDSIFERIIEFRLEDDIEIPDAVVKVESLLNEYYKVIPYWKNCQQMYKEKPITNSDDFKLRIETLNTYVVMYAAFKTEITALHQWIGNDDPEAEGAAGGIEDIKCAEKPIAEQVLKEKDIETIFQKKIFYRHGPWVFKAKLAAIEYGDYFNLMNLPSLNGYLTTLITFPMKLIKEIILIRLNYARKLQKPTMMMIDQMIDDFKSYIKLAVQIIYTINLYCSNKELQLGNVIDDTFDKTVNDAISYFFKLLNLKLVDSTKKSFKNFKEPEALFSHWEDLKNVGCHIDGANEVVPTGFVSLTLRLLNKLHAYILKEQNSVTEKVSKAECEKWIMVTLENIGLFKRKMNRFSNVLTKALQNSANYRINDIRLLLQNLKDTGHFLIYTGGYLEDSGTYLFASKELLGYSGTDILRIVKGMEVGSDLIPEVSITNSLSVYTAIEQGVCSDPIFVQEERPDGLSYYHVQSECNKRHIGKSRGKIIHSYDSFYGSETEGSELYELERKLKSLGYLVAVCPDEPILWEGEMYNLSYEKQLNAEDFPVNITPGMLTLMAQGSTYSMEYQCDKFQHFAGNSVVFTEKRCSIVPAEQTLQKINKAYFRITYHTLAHHHKLVSTIQRKFRGFESLNTVFIFCRDFAKNFLRSNVASYETKSVIIMQMLKVSIGWLTFLIDDCDPNDPKTFRWCVLAMEFAMQMTSGWNILGISGEQFKTLKDKISGCMALLISHFDIMGVRSREAENTVMPQVRAIMDFETDDEETVQQLNTKMRLKAINELEQNTVNTRRQVGKVLDATDKDNQYLLTLASSLSNVSIKWQKRSFIGGGSFGSVYSAVNLDTGDILAVKEIKFNDRKTIKQVFPSIRDEMTVLEMLNHPNVVQYYGVEVHRDRVNIFMEYCEGGSLASLLAHGRIEDEMVTQVYSLQMLEGLAYLHESGVDHRDIKPENILLDFNGIIKYVDFGAAKVLASNGSKKLNLEQHMEGEKMIGTPMYMSPEAISGTGYGKFGSDDIWSLGCVILEMVTGRRPWANLDNQWAIIYQVAAGQIPMFPSKNEMSQAGIKFLSRCLIQDPNQRSTAVELLMDPWIIEIRTIAFGDDTVEPVSKERPLNS